MSRAIEALRPRDASQAWLDGWHAHRAGHHRTSGKVPYSVWLDARRETEYRAEWRRGWDARHRLSVQEASMQAAR